MKRRISVFVSILLWGLLGPISVQAQLGNLIGGGGPSPNQLRKQGKFPEALVAYLEEIAEKPGKRGPLKSLGKEYPELMDSIQARQSRLVEATLAFQGDATVGITKTLIDHYRTLQRAHEVFAPLGISNIEEKKVQVTLDIPDVQAEIAAAEGLLVQHTAAAAEMHYQQGLVHATYNEVERQKAAAREFVRAMDFVPGYKDAQEKYEAARALGTKRIIILPYANLSNMNAYGALGNQLSDQLIAKLSENQQVMEFLQVISESELRAVLQNQGQAYDDNISDATAGDLLRMTQAHVVYFGKINQVLLPNPTTTNSDVLSHTARVKVGEETIWDPKKNKEVKRDKYEERTATYRAYTKTYPVSVSGAHSLVTAAGPQLSPYTKSLTWSENWTQKVAGHDEVYKKVQQVASPIPSPGVRVNYIIEQIAQELYVDIRNEILGAQYPLITRMDELESP